MAPLFSKVDSNKLWHDVQNEETVICAKFVRDLFNISKVIGRKKVAQFFLTHSVDLKNFSREKPRTPDYRGRGIKGGGQGSIILPTSKGRGREESIGGRGKIGEGTVHMQGGCCSKVLGGIDASDYR